MVQVSTTALVPAPLHAEVRQPDDHCHQLNDWPIIGQMGPLRPPVQDQAYLQNETLARTSQMAFSHYLSLQIQQCNQHRAQHESICRWPVLEPVGLVNMWGHHLDPNRFKRWITWPADDYLQVACVYLRMPKAP